MDLRNTQILDEFRALAITRDIPAADVEKWLELVRPFASMTADGDGPVLGRFGGPIMLPADASEPWCPLIAIIDCAALPKEATDLSLPPDGKLLLFGYPDHEVGGSAAYVPAGTAVEERHPASRIGDEADEETLEILREYPLGDIHLSLGVCLPSDGLVPVLAEMWKDLWEYPTLMLGGHGRSHDFDPVRDAAAEASFLASEELGLPHDPDAVPSGMEDWVLLAQCCIYRAPGADIFWMIRPGDLAERCFDQVRVLVDYNP
ncbi:DUF1963 domain-containing protein [Amycolatopsis sp. CA-126428]|uniref:DUF1963 domain-containing protein n=1 Tax=Amycolatopsis sp. CA-126428 TaxID=2073158 RepID=UPI0011B03E32|nr:DUF1963 domain-containing protein [Amycolatopsis sp. CA-126428]